MTPTVVIPVNYQIAREKYICELKLAGSIVNV